MTKSQKWLTISICLTCLVLCVITLVLYFVFRPKTTPSSLIILSDIEVEVGTEKIIEYSLSDTSAKVNFTTGDEKVAKVSGIKVKGIKEGETFLKAIITLGSKTYESTSKIKVVAKEDPVEIDPEIPDEPDPEDPSDTENETPQIPPDTEDPPQDNKLYITLSPKSNCSFDEDTKTLTLTNSSAAISIEVYEDEAKTKPLTFASQFIYETSTGIDIDANPGVWILECSQNGTITLKSKNLSKDLILVINVVLV